MGCQRTMSVDAPWASSSLIDSAWPASLARCSRVCSSSTVAFTSRKCSWSQLPSTSVSPALDAAMAPWTSGGGNGATAVRRGDQGLREAKNGPVRGDAPLRHGSAPVLSAFARSGMSGGLQLHGKRGGFLLFIFKYFCGSILPGVFIILRLYEPRTNEHTANGCGLRPVSPRASYLPMQTRREGVEDVECRAL